MIERLKYLDNIGRFDTVNASDQTDFGALTLVYSENGLGKTTLCAVLRSLSSGDAAPILERRRLSAANESHAVVCCDGAEIAFDGTSWTAPGPRVLIYDDHFVDANVCSGLEVEASHRKGVHALVLGERGVKHEREVKRLTEEITEHHADLRAAESAISQDTRAGLSMDAFCALEEPVDLQKSIDETKRQLSIMRDAQEIAGANLFRALGLPELREEELRATLAASLASIDAAALRAVGDHIVALGEGAESWIAEGTNRLGDSDQCPFCAQDVSRQELVSSYRLYFSSEYRDHKRRVQEARRAVEDSLGGDRLAEFERTAQRARSLTEFWAKHTSLPEFKLDTEELARVWTDARTHLLSLLDKKAGALLDAVVFDGQTESAVAAFQSAAAWIADLSRSLLAANDDIVKVKSRASSGDAVALESKLARLEATKRRGEPEVAEQCEVYLAATAKKAAAEKRKQEARRELDTHRKEAFGRQEDAINRFLALFNAGFRIRSLAPSDARGVPSSTYELVVNGVPVPLATPTEPEPSFRTSLSAGDRNTLALAFFLASLEECSSLQDAIVVLDDPCCSLDDGRRFATAQEIRRLVHEAAQVVVMSHSPQLLCHLWEGSDGSATAALRIRDAGTDSSTIDAWDVAAASVSEYARQHKLIRDYLDAAHCDARAVASALRMVLERFARIRFVEHFRPGDNLGCLVARARQASESGTPIMADASLAELDSLREYANQFHHDTDGNSQQNLSSLSASELKGFAQRVITFAGAGHAI